MSEQTTEKPGIPGIATVTEGKGGLPMVLITSTDANAEIYLHGAHVTSWQPWNVSDDVIFVSKATKWEDGKAIRGGIPICWPWFGAKADDPKAPSHGFARTRAWKLHATAQTEEGVVVELLLESDEDTRKLWPHDFRLVHRVTFGSALKAELILTNTGTAEFTFEEAQHTYYRVGDASQVKIEGLDGVSYLDKRDSNAKKQQQGPVIFEKPTDRVYLDTAHAVDLIDPVLGRRIHVEKQNSLTTVVWNPGAEGAKAFADMEDDEWKKMACIEACNVGAFAVKLAPGASHTMTTLVTVDFL
ncbi:D-hexose-6-phosphate mutarotase [Silvibacterium acidisoli]|uniref:D-hexose-6-phosphate mutarotase n=1 Tax=Acidobacteriaceae bacterium ZG23-2 TaxID=2883246 RepID=UPI00406CD5C7